MSELELASTLNVELYLQNRQMWLVSSGWLLESTFSESNVTHALIFGTKSVALLKVGKVGRRRDAHFSTPERREERRSMTCRYR